MFNLRNISLLFLAFSFLDSSANHTTVRPDIKDPKSKFYSYQGEVFAALQIPSNIKAKIASIQEQILRCLGKDKQGKQKFTPADSSNLHITLQLISPVTTHAHFTNIHMCCALLLSTISRGT